MNGAGSHGATQHARTLHRQARFAGASALAALLLAGCGGTASVVSAPAKAAASPASAPAKPAAGSGRIRLGASQNITANAPLWLTGQVKLFEQNGLNVDLQSISATQAIKQLVAGQLDAVAVGAPEAVSARAAGSPVQVVAVFQSSCDMELVAPNDVTSVDQLKGKTVAVITKPSVEGICTVADLRKHGLQPDTDYKLIETGSNGTYAAVVAALQGKHATAGALQPDFAHRLEADGQFHTLYDMASEPNLTIAAGTLTFPSAFIQAHPDEVQKTLDSILQGEAYYKQHKDEAQNLLKTTFKITDPKQLDETYSRQGQLLAKDVTPKPELFPDIVDALSQVEPDVKNLDINSLLVQKFAQSAQQRGLPSF